MRQRYSNLAAGMIGAIVALATTALVPSSVAPAGAATPTVTGSPSSNLP